MRKHKDELTDFLAETDTGSYQTGASRPPRPNNGIVTALLIAVILLGGLASAFGIINFRLMSMMMEQKNALQPLATDTATIPTATSALTDQNHDPLPTIPELRQLQILLDQLHEDKTPESIYHHNEQALVSVYCSTLRNEIRSGTGVILSQDGYILTNAHIIDSHQRVFVHLQDGQLMRAAVVGSDPFTDLAVLYVQAQDLTPAIFVTSDIVNNNDDVHALNNQPDAEHNFLLSGKVYTMGPISTGDLSVDLLSSSLWGDSGPVFDSNGRIIAIRAGKIRDYFSKDYRAQQGMAIPSQAMVQVVQQLITHGHVPGRPSLDIQVEPISLLYQHYWDLPGGLLVTQLDADGLAAEHGLQEGDILLTLDGVVLTSRSDLYSALYAAQIGDELIAAIFRDGRKFTINLIVTETQQ